MNSKIGWALRIILYSGEKTEKYLTVAEKLSDKHVRELYKMLHNLLY